MKALSVQMTREQIQEQTRVWYDEKEYCQKMMELLAGAQIAINRYFERYTTASDQHDFWVGALEHFDLKASQPEKPIQ